MGLAVIGSLSLFAQPNMQNCPKQNKSEGMQGRHGQGQFNKGEEMMAHLNLSDEQKTKIEDLKLEHQKKMLPLRNQLNEKMAKMKTLETAFPADMKAIDALIDEMSGVRTQMAKERAAMHQEVRKILTEEQRIKFDTRPGQHRVPGNPGMEMD